MRPDVVVERHDHVARADRRGGGQPARPEAVHPQHVAVPPEGRPPHRGGRGRVVALAHELREQVLHARAARRLAVGPPRVSSSARSASSATRTRAASPCNDVAPRAGHERHVAPRLGLRARAWAEPPPTPRTSASGTTTAAPTGTTELPGPPSRSRRLAARRTATTLSPRYPAGQRALQDERVAAAQRQQHVLRRHVRGLQSTAGTRGRERRRRRRAPKRAHGPRPVPSRKNRAWNSSSESTGASPSIATRVLPRQPLRHGVMSTAPPRWGRTPGRGPAGAS